MNIGPLRIEECFVSQHGLRNEPQLPGMIEFIKKGFRFNKDGLHPPGPLIHIARFPDGKLYIQDGHHRLCAIVLAGRPFIWEDEYVLSDWDYSDYLDINFDQNWVTPYDIRTEVRYADYGQYKKDVFKVLNEKGEHEATEFILGNTSAYCRERQYYNILAMIDRMGLRRFLC